jgi:Flp pilus assembly protein TadD
MLSGLLAAGLLLPGALAAQEGTLAIVGGCASPGDEARRREQSAVLRAAEERSAAEDWQGAEAQYRQAVALDPSDPLGLYGLGQSLMGQKRYLEAVQAFEGCREAFRCLTLLPPEERKALERRRDVAIREIRDALRTMETEAMRVTSIRGSERDLNQDLTHVRAETSRRALSLEARLHELEQWRKRGNLNERPPAAVSLAIGSAHFQAGALDRAEAGFREALVTEPRSGDAHNNLAVVLMLTGRLDEAEAEVKLAEKAGVSVNPRLHDEIQKRRAQR